MVQGQAGSGTVASYCTEPEKVTEPLRAAPSHSMLIRHVPAIANADAAEYLPGTADLWTSIVANIGMPGIGIVADARTLPTSTSVPPGVDLNAMMKSSLPWRSVSRGERSTMSSATERTRCSSVILEKSRLRPHAG